jgi:hypothetical protein
MASQENKPTIFISYSHKDEPDELLHPNAERWLTFVKSHLGPAVAHGHFETWDDRVIEAGGNWKKEIDNALSTCAVCILLVSRHFLNSPFILDVEMKAILERHHAKDVQLFPIIITACDLEAANWLMKFNLRPRDGRAIESYAPAQRNEIMASLAREIRSIADRQSTIGSQIPQLPQQIIEVTRLPQTAYKRLVGREREIDTLNEAWAGVGTNILSLIAWGGSGKTTLVKDWLTRIQLLNYGGAEAVLSWSFYDQGTKERATSADIFLEWALKQLGAIEIPTDANQRAELLSRLLKGRRILLILDGVEPLQYGPGPQEGLLKDVGLRSFLRRCAAEPPVQFLGLVILTSRLVIKDLGPPVATGPTRVIELDQLSDDAGAALLADNEVIGSTAELKAASNEFGGHALALSLLAGFLVRRYSADIKLRSNVGPLLASGGRTVDELVHGHAKRVMRSIETEWLKDNPLNRTIMDIVSLFDRPVRSELIDELKPAFFPNAPPSSSEWSDAVADLRAVRLLAPIDRTAPTELDTHPLVRDWFGSQLETQRASLWQRAHRSIFRFLKDTTNEGAEPSAASLQPIYQAIAHGCKAGLYEDAAKLYYARVARQSQHAIHHYSSAILGLVTTDLAILSLFFEEPYERVRKTISDQTRIHLISTASSHLTAVGRVAEGAKAQSSILRYLKQAKLTPSGYANVARIYSNLAISLYALGRISEAITAAQNGITSAYRAAKDVDTFATVHGAFAFLRYTEGKLKEAWQVIETVDQKIKGRELRAPGHLGPKINMLLLERRWDEAMGASAELARIDTAAFTQGTALLGLARASLGVALSSNDANVDARFASDAIGNKFAESIDVLRKAELAESLARGFVFRSMFGIANGDWNAATSDLDQAEEIAAPSSMVLLLADIAIQRARLILDRRHKSHPGLGDNVIHEKQSVARLLERASEIRNKTGYHLQPEVIGFLKEKNEGKRVITSLPIQV